MAATFVSRLSHDMPTSLSSDGGSFTRIDTQSSVVGVKLPEIRLFKSSYNRNDPIYPLKGSRPLIVRYALLQPMLPFAAQWRRLLPRLGASPEPTRTRRLSTSRVICLAVLLTVGNPRSYYSGCNDKNVYSNKCSESK